MQASRALHRAILLATLAVAGAASAADRVGPPALAPAVGTSTAEGLRGTLVENRSGAVIGRIGDVVRGSDGGLLAVIRPGQVAADPSAGALVPLVNFTEREGYLRATTGHTAQSVAAAREPAAVETSPVPQDIRLSALAEGGSLEEMADRVPKPLPFSDLDLDHDGVLSSSEAHASMHIGDRWRTLDVNNDGVLDRSEVSVLYGDAPPTAEEADR